MALDAVSLMRARVRGTPSWPGHDPETGYVGADRSDHSQKLLADGAGHTFLKAATVSSSLAGWRGRALTCEKPSCLRILPIVRSWEATPKRSATICGRSTRRQRTTPCTARSGPVSTTSASCPSCSAERRGGWPFDQLSLSPSGARSLKRCPPSPSVWRFMPPIRAASARLIPSTTAASDSRRRLWLACLEAAPRRRSSSAEKSTLTVTAVAMARILPHHGISSTSRGESPTRQNGRPLVLPPASSIMRSRSAAMKGVVLDQDASTNQGSQLDLVGVHSL